MAIRRRPVTKQDVDGPQLMEDKVESPIRTPIETPSGTKKSGVPGIPDNEWEQPERAGTSPRENPSLGGGLGSMGAALRAPSGGGQATPSRPMAPTSMAGSSFTPPQGITPFKPMGGPAVSSLANPARRGLYGSMGGLQGGGLGLPLDPVSDQESDPISSLIKLLLGGR